jgi:hypothetical protein
MGAASPSRTFISSLTALSFVSKQSLLRSYRAVSKSMNSIGRFSVEFIKSLLWVFSFAKTLQETLGSGKSLTQWRFWTRLEN